MMDALERLEREADRALWLADPQLAAELGVTELPRPVPAPLRERREGAIPPRPPDSDDTFPKREAVSFTLQLVVVAKTVLAVIARALQFERVLNWLRAELASGGRHSVRPRQPTRKPGGPPPQPPPRPYLTPGRQARR